MLKSRSSNPVHLDHCLFCVSFISRYQQLQLDTHISSPSFCCYADVVLLLVTEAIVSSVFSFLFSLVILFAL